MEFSKSMTLRLSCCDLEWQFREKPITYLKSAPSNQVYLMCHINIEKSQMYRVSQGFCMTYRVTLRKKLPMDDFKNGQNPSSRMCRRYFKRNLGWWRPIDSILIQAQCEPFYGRLLVLRVVFVCHGLLNCFIV